MNNILLVTGGYNRAGVGEQFLQAMLKEYPKQNICRYSTVTQKDKLDCQHYGYNTITKKVPYSNLPIIASIKFWQFKKKALSLCVNQIVDIVVEKEIDIIWVVLNTFHTIQIAAAISVRIDLPFVAHIWDTPEYLSKVNRLDAFTRKSLLSDFGSFMRKATHGITVSDSMASIYLEKYKLECESMVFCPPIEAIKEVREITYNRNVISIVFAGSLYAYKEWDAFLDALEKRKEENQSLTINVRCIGNVSRWSKKRNWVTYESIKPISEAAEIVNSADIAYLPYWMDKSHAYTVKTAFPGKMSFYVAAGCPVFFHGPKDSTPTTFLTNNKVGIACHSKKASEILSAFDNLLSDSFQKCYKSEQKETLEKVFHPNNIIYKFNKVIGLVSSTSN